MHVIKGQRRRLYKAALAPQKENGIKKQPLSFRKGLLRLSNWNLFQNLLPLAVFFQEKVFA